MVSRFLALLWPFSPVTYRDFWLDTSPNRPWRRFQQTTSVRNEPNRGNGENGSMRLSIGWRGNRKCRCTPFGLALFWPFAIVSLNRNRKCHGHRPPVWIDRKLVCSTTVTAELRPENILYIARCSLMSRTKFLIKCWICFKVNCESSPHNALHVRVLTRIVCSRRGCWNSMYELILHWKFEILAIRMARSEIPRERKNVRIKRSFINHNIHVRHLCENWKLGSCFSARDLFSNHHRKWIANIFNASHRMIDGNWIPNFNNIEATDCRKNRVRVWSSSRMVCMCVQTHPSQMRWSRSLVKCLASVVCRRANATTLPIAQWPANSAQMSN